MSANDEAELRKFQKEFAIKRKGSTTPNSGDEPVKNNSSSDIQQAAEAAEAAEVTEVVEAADTCK
jgi:hypothetical protein